MPCGGCSALHGVNPNYQTPYPITNTDRIKLENRSDIREEYTKFYKKLLKNQGTK